MGFCIGAIQGEIFPVSDSGHERDPKQVSQAKDRGTLCLGISMDGIWPDRRLLFRKQIEDVRSFPDLIWRDDLSHMCIIHSLLYRKDSQHFPIHTHQLKNCWVSCRPNALQYRCDSIVRKLKKEGNFQTLFSRM